MLCLTRTNLAPILLLSDPPAIANPFHLCPAATDYERRLAHHDARPTMKLVSSAVSLLALVPLAWLVFVPAIWRMLGLILGWYLRRKTEGRRAQLRELMDADEKTYEEAAKTTKMGSDDDDDDDWENVDAYAPGTAKNGGSVEKDWDGIVGFFHPFW